MASWDVMRELDNLKREIDEAFRSGGQGRSPHEGPFLPPLTPRRFPLVDVSEDEGSLYVDVLLPGVDPAGIDLTLVRNTITISGERKPFAPQEGQIVHRSELGSGKFSRTLDLSVDVDPNKIKAHCKDGIMHIVLGKSQHAKPKKIEIKQS